MKSLFLLKIRTKKRCNNLTKFEIYDHLCSANLFLVVLSWSKVLVSKRVVKYLYLELVTRFVELG